MCFLFDCLDSNWFSWKISPPTKNCLYNYIYSLDEVVCFFFPWECKVTFMQGSVVNIMTPFQSCLILMKLGAFPWNPMETRQDVVRQFPTLPAQYHPWPEAWDWRDRARNLFLLFLFHGPRSSFKSPCLDDEVSVDMEELYHWKCLFVTILSFLHLCFCWTKRARFLTLPSCFWHKKRLWITGSWCLGWLDPWCKCLLCFCVWHLSTYVYLQLGTRVSVFSSLVWRMFTCRTLSS